MWRERSRHAKSGQSPRFSEKRQPEHRNKRVRQIMRKPSSAGLHEHRCTSVGIYIYGHMSDLVFDARIIITQTNFMVNALFVAHHDQTE